MSTMEYSDDFHVMPTMSKLIFVEEQFNSKKKAFQ